jgi:hypothetical protein
VEPPFVPQCLACDPSAWRPVDLDRFLVGAPHYPEHVDESYWERDAARMAVAGFNVVRMGEFAWEAHRTYPIGLSRR